jgi:1-acyl-sn-glycerol-3-phosphate acyltransferase
VTNEEAHRLARERGVSRPLYAVVKLILGPFLRVWYRLGIAGAEHIPTTGAAIVAPNHKSLYDSFFIGLATRRHLRFMGKSELFEGPFGRLLVRLGAFPVRRGASDQDALETARVVLRQGGLLSLFPEGTRVRDPDTLGSPRRGAGRLAIEAQAPLVPCAITGTEKLFWGPFPRPGRVQLAFTEAIAPAELESTPEAAAELIEGQVWPEVEREWRRLRARPGLIAAALAALGIGGGLAYRARRGGRGPSISLPGGKRLRLPPLPGRKRKRGPFRR